MEIPQSPQTRRPEIIHREKYDVLINTGYANQSIARTLAAEVQDGLPDSWSKYVPQYLLDRHPPTSDFIQNLKLYVDNPAAPKFFAKRRVNTSPQRVHRAREQAEFRPGDWNRQQQFAFNSLLNEFRMTPLVKTALDSPAAQAIATKYGFTDIKLVEPILGLIERATGIKIMIYDFLSADQPRDKPNPPSKNKLAELSSVNWDIFLIYELGRLFKNNNINPTDIDTTQLMSSKDDGTNNFRLYLYDIEGYVPNPPQK